MVFVGCENYGEHLPYQLFKLKAGNHYPNIEKLGELESHFLSYDIIFDSTVIYATKDPANQADVNKLFGFADCNNFHHDNSVRFGWRWNLDSSRVEILGYAYVDSKRVISDKIWIIEIDKPYTYTIILADDHYELSLNNETILMPRGNTCDTGGYYLLWPYFGGDEVSPHDIHIYIKRHFKVS